jgi:hypothetical protein
VAHYCQTSSFASNMQFLVLLLSALLACAASKCYSYSNVILDGRTYRIYIYQLSSLVQSPEKVYFFYIVKRFSPRFVESNIHHRVHKINPIVSIRRHSSQLKFSQSKLKILFKIICPQNSIFSK